MSDAYAAGQESTVQVVTDALKEVFEPDTISSLRVNARPEFFGQAVADLVALRVLDKPRLTKRETEQNRWKMGYWTGRAAERERIVGLINNYSTNWGNLLLADSIRHLAAIRDLIESEPLKE
jgi:hypothetical protein